MNRTLFHFIQELYINEQNMSLLYNYNSKTLNILKVESCHYQTAKRTFKSSDL